MDPCQKARALIRAAGSGFSATAKYDLASKGVLASLTQLRKLDGGRLLEASAVWSSRTQQWLLEATGRPHAAHKVSATCAPGCDASAHCCPCGLRGPRSPWAT